MAYSKAVETATKNFVGTYGKDIIKAIADTGLFFQAVVAQKALESGWGKSTLATKYNNFGGIKNFGSLSGAGVVEMSTTEVKNGKVVKVNQPFATFSSPFAAFQSYVRVLQDPTKKYTSMGVFTAATPEDQIRAMAKAGYTTTPPEEYLKSMASIIEACSDLYPYGKIESNSPNTEVRNVMPFDPKGTKGVASIAGSLVGSLKGYFNENK